MHYQKIDAFFDITALCDALAAQPQLFGQHTARAKAPGSPHRDMTDIWVRYNDLAQLGPHFNDEHDAVWYPAFDALPELAPIVFDLMRHVQGERLGGVLITKLPPGGVIATHTDGGWHADYYEKFYIALRSAPGAVFQFPDGAIHAEPGECYWFDNSVPHSVHNDTDTERLALIVCIKTRHFTRPRHG